MKLKLTPDIQKRINANAVQLVIQKRISQLIEARAEEITKELELLDKEYTPESLVEIYVGTTSDIALPAKTLLVPAHTVIKDS